MSLADYLRQPRNKRERRVANHAKKKERERIIALLEAEGLEWRPLKDNPRNLIALIKGE